MKLSSLLSLATKVAAVTISVSKDGGKDASPLQYGLMFEDINFSGDGGIYAELIRNRAFQGDEFTPSTLDPWSAFGPADISLSNLTPHLSSALPTSVAVKGKVGEEIGISNPGYWGIDILPQTYKGSFWAFGDYRGDFKAALRSASSGEILTSVNIPSHSNTRGWTKHEFVLDSDIAAGYKTNFTLTFVAKSGHQALNFNLISLFPPTYNNRENGLRRDLMQSLKDLNPSFMRIPGGNNLQGKVPGSRWKWNETIGDLIDRPGRTGPWRYYNTDGLGLIEYMLWCQDLEVEPVLILWAGLYLDGTVIPEDGLDFYVRDALHEIEFLTGDASTEYGAKRVALGYETPFEINFVGVGNEDHFSSGMKSYNEYRFRMFFDAISERYPHLQILSSTVELDPIPKGAVLDYHDYGNPDGAVRNFTLFDDQDESNKVLVGEYGVARNNGNEILWKDHRKRPWWIASVAEAVFYLGVERNPDKVFGCAFAPLLQNIESYQWNPNLITFNANTSATVKSTSFHVMGLLSNNRFTTLLPIENSEEYDPGFWVAGLNEDINTYVWKAAVYNTTTEQAFEINFPGSQQGAVAELTVLTAPDAFSENVFGEPDLVDTKKTRLEAGQEGFTFVLPQWSVAVLNWKYTSAT
ncbi:unnamed protein product [Clonostachys rosea f. rosea IK726]|uniref:non-reducing end alpha-L-arabinofuranosidase n=2 Tax=Bionectria ochroleuca TaxID=29856 RepID=A0A0B7KBC0_BIOOC|nr:unnamed protein product [Clonostachys rosea f. rosea IK726]